MNNNEIIDFIENKRNEMKEKYNRVLPTNELLYDRWDKAKFLNAGERTNIYDTSVIMGDVKIGSDCWIGPYTLLEGVNGRLELGNWVCISSGVMIYTHDTSKYFVSGGKAPVKVGDVKIGDYTQIGSMSMVCANVNIGKHCIIGANSLVNKDVKDNTIVAGTPAKPIGKVIIDGNNTRFEYYNK